MNINNVNTTTWLRLNKLVFLLLLGMIAIACGGEEVGGNSAENSITGPAFVLFFTDP